MLEFVTKAEAYEHLRLDYDSDGSADDPWLEIFIPAVSEAVAGWLKESWRPYELERDSDGALVLNSDDEPVPVLDSDGNPVVRWAVKAACLTELESLYRFRSGDSSVEVPSHAGWGYTLGRAATGLLTFLRKPTVA